jgi:transposase-like protein
MMSKSNQSVFSSISGRRHWRQSDAEAVVSAWRESGVSVSAFARRHGINVARLLRWRRRLAGNGETIQFHPVAVVAGSNGESQSPDRQIELVLGNGRRVVVQPGFDSALLEQLVRAVESWPC